MRGPPSHPSPPLAAKNGLNNDVKKHQKSELLMLDFIHLNSFSIIGFNCKAQTAPFFNEFFYGLGGCR